MQKTIPIMGKTGIQVICRGTLKGLRNRGSLNLKKIREAFIAINVIKIVKLVTLATNRISPMKENAIDSNMTVNIAIQGVLVWG